jgi:hypothetical protein
MKRLFALLAVLASAPVWPQQRCAPDHVDVIQDHVSATADPGQNLRKSPGSLRAEVSRLGKKVLDEAATSSSPNGNACSPSCSVVEGSAHALFSIVPNKVLNGYADERKCEELLKQTTSHPLKFSHSARSEKELGVWLSDVSKGRREDGAALYNKCGGRCSPRYFADVVQDGSGFTVNLDVVCGPARDKEDNTYGVSSGYRWACRATP